MALPIPVVTRQAGRGALLALRPPAERPRDAGRRTRRILVATDGAPDSRGAMTLAGLLARRDGAAVHVISVLERWGAPPPVHELLGATAELMSSRLSRVLVQAAAAFGRWNGWTLSIADGGVASVVGHLAEAEGFDLVLVGLRRQWLARLFRPTALRIAHRSQTPVLAVPPSVTALPRRAVVGIDGGEAALSAARTAARLLDAPASVHLVHVVTARTPYDVGLAPLFDRHVRELDGLGLAAIEGRALEGREPAAALLAYAGRTQPELIAIGSHEQTSLKGRLLGGVSGRILRAARCCVLLSGRAAVASHSPREPRESREVGDDERPERIHRRQHA